MKQKQFLEVCAPICASPMRSEAGMLGWALSRNGVTLERNRGGPRTFKSKDSVDAFCAENGIDGYETRGLLKGL